MIRVALIDDENTTHDAVSLLLDTVADISLVAQGYNGQEAIRICEMVKPNVMLMDVMMPVMDGIEATQQIIDQHPDMRILVLSNIHDHDSVKSILLNGAAGYILKGNLTQDLIPTLRAVHRGTGAFSPEIVQQLAQFNAPTNPYNLTEREIEVLTAMAQGLTFKDVGNQLHISTSTVKYHLGNIQDKFGVSTRVEALIMAAKSHLI